MSNQENKTASTVWVVMLITLAGKGMGLWRDRLLAQAYGTSMEANAFYTASRIPRVFFDTIFASAIALCLIPILTRTTSQQGEEAGNRFAGNFISVMASLSAILTLLGIVFADSMVALFAQGYNPETQALATQLTQLMFPTVFFTGLAFSFVGILQLKERFFIPAFMSCLSNLVIILYFYLWNAKYGIFGLGIAFLLGWFAQVLIQLPSLKQIGFTYHPNFSPTTPEMKQVFLLMAPVMVATWVQPINLTINTRFASYLYEGAGVTIIEIATNLYLILAGVFVLSLTNVIFPKLTKQTTQGQEEDFRQTLLQTLHISLFFTLPMSAGLWVVAEPLVTLLYGGGEFDALAITRTAQALQLISLGMAGFGVQNIVSRAYFAQEEGKVPLIAGAISILTNLLLCSLLVDTLEITGLALSSFLSSTLYGVILLVALHKKSTLFTLDFLVDMGKMLLLSLSMVIWAGWVLSKTLFLGEFLAMVITAGVGALGYALLSLLVGLWEAKYFLNLFQKG